MPPPRFTLTQAFFAGQALVTLLVGLLFYLFVDGSRASLLASADRLRDGAARSVERVVRAQLGEAEDALGDVERRLRAKAAQVDNPHAVGDLLEGQVLDRPDVAEITFTRASRSGFAADGTSHLDHDRWLVSVFRRPDTGERLWRLQTAQGPAPPGELRIVPPFESSLREGDGPPRRVGEAPDPTTHPTFATLAHRRHRGRAVWSDLHYSALDADRPEASRRVVVTLQKAVEDTDGRLLGVLRIGLLPRQLDDVTRVGMGNGDPSDPHLVFLCDDRGRLITRPSPDDRFAEDDDDLRVQPTALPEPVAAALKSPLLAAMASPDTRGDASGAFVVAGARHLVTFRALRGTQGWIVGIVVPEAHYTAPLERARWRSQWLFVAVTLAVVAGGALAMRALRRGLRRLSDSTARMRRFDFEADLGAPGAFRDVFEVVESLERGKTIVRAMGKYLPLDLVRRLYESNRDPVLGGELETVTLMFTDIEGFTTLAEKLSPSELAAKLGLYLETMTTAIQATGGTIDKYIGDAVMALWNAPTAVPEHEQAACRAALACVAATRELYASPAWEGLPPLVTRHGIHCDQVLVGHFGAPTRLSYTALGDGVNLAARLEPLCKQYGVLLAVSEFVEAAAREAFAFRRLDRVAVKGKTKGIVVYELLGPRGDPGLPLAVVETYEAALGAYFERRFADAITLLERQPEDPPSRVLLERCARLREAAPPEGWDGVYVASSK